ESRGRAIADGTSRLKSGLHSHPDAERAGSSVVSGRLSRAEVGPLSRGETVRWLRPFENLGQLSCGREHPCDPTSPERYGGRRSTENDAASRSHVRQCFGEIVHFVAYMIGADPSREIRGDGRTLPERSDQFNERHLVASIREKTHCHVLEGVLKGA